MFGQPQQQQTSSSLFNNPQQSQPNQQPQQSSMFSNQPIQQPSMFSNQQQQTLFNQPLQQQPNFLSGFNPAANPTHLPTTNTAPSSNPSMLKPRKWMNDQCISNNPTVLN